MNRLLAAELLKIRTTRVWWGLLLGVVGLTAIGSVATAATAGLGAAGGRPGLPAATDPAMLRSIYTAGFSPAYTFVLVLGTLIITGEYRHQTISHTLLVTPRRTRVVVAKLAAAALMGLVYAVVAAVVAAVAGASTLAIRGYPVGLASTSVAGAVGLTVLGTAIWGALGLGLGILIRNQIAAVVTGIVGLILLEGLLALLLNVVHAGVVAKFLPTQASSAIVAGVSTGADQLPWWAGALVLLAWGALFAAAGTFTTLRRDVT